MAAAVAAETEPPSSAFPAGIPAAPWVVACPVVAACRAAAAHAVTCLARPVVVVAVAVAVG